MLTIKKKKSIVKYKIGRKSFMTSQKPNTEHVGTLFGMFRGDSKLTNDTEINTIMVIHFENR